MLLTNRLMPILSLVFFAFIIWIIVVSDSGRSNFLIDSVRAIPYGDKIGHMSLYAVLAALVNISMKPSSIQVASKNLNAKKHFGLPLECALVLAFALMEELSQGLFPSTRTLDIEDAVADFIGIYLAAWITRKQYNFRENVT